MAAPPTSQEDFMKGFLVDDESDQEPYNSDADELQKGHRNPKRRKLEDDDDSDVDSDVVPHVEAGRTSSNPSVVQPKTSNSPTNKAAEEGGHEQDTGEQNRKSTTPNEPGETGTKTQKKKSRLEKEAEKSTMDAKNSGVVYLSRIPPFMKPHKLRTLLEPYGKIRRIYLAPEDQEARKSRVRNGGNKKVSYTEGWVEFARKFDAKKACDLLNTRSIGGKKSSFYYDDIWTMMYLKGFKWHHLTEQMEAENKERESRLRAEIDKTTRENEAFVRNIDKAKMLKTMDTKRKRAAKDDGDGEQGGAKKASLLKNNGLKQRRTLQPETKQVISRIF